MLKLYGSPPTRAIRPIWLLNELGLDCEIVPLNPITPKGRKTLLAVNPFGKAPVLVDGDVTIAESVAIMFHLAETRGGGRFLPTDAGARALMFQWNFFLVTEIEQPLWRMGLHTVIYREDERNTTEVALARRDCRRFLEPLDAHLNGRDTMVGDEVTLTDFNAAFTLDWCSEEGLLDAFPNCLSFVERMYDRPAAPVRTVEGFAYLNAGDVPPRYRRDVAAEYRAQALRRAKGDER